MTLIELLMVITILAVLVGVALAGVGGLSENADVNACKVEKSTLKEAITASVGTNSPTDTWSDHIQGGPSGIKWFTISGTTLVTVPGAPCS